MGDVLSLIKDGTHGTHRDAESGPLLLSAKNIKNGTVQWDESDRRISEDEYNIIHSNFRLQKGDVLLTIVGSIGEVAILSQSEGVTFQRSVAFLRPSDEICSEFLYSEIQGQKFQKELNDRKSTSAQPGIYLGDLGAIPIEFPTSDEEQMQIGSYFSTIDHLITLHQRKIYIFIKKMPIDWEQRKLGEVFEQTTNFVNLSKDDIELWSLTVEDGLTPKSERYNREFLVKKDTNFKEVRPGDIVYNPMNMTLGAVGYNGMSKSVAISGYYTTMITKDGNDSYYINTWLKSPQAISLYKIYATGSLIEKQRVQFPTLSTIPAVFPKYEEQHKIGCYFEAIDHLITLHHRKRVILKKMKVSDWEQRKLGEVFEQTTNFVNLSKDDIELWSLTVEDGLTPKSERYMPHLKAEKQPVRKKYVVLINLLLFFVCWLQLL